MKHNKRNEHDMVKVVYKKTIKDKLDEIIDGFGRTFSMTEGEFRHYYCPITGREVCKLTITDEEMEELKANHSHNLEVAGLVKNVLPYDIQPVYVYRGVMVVKEEPIAIAGNQAAAAQMQAQCSNLNLNQWGYLNGGQ